jgi:NADH:ubiquinone oxidoreductase subunit F (NADH-binding)/(2Fe-2S) ferredoxin/Pyruvate/2-oxoacid:ferredoxin oxidoreductase delta subunit
MVSTALENPADLAARREQLRARRASCPQTVFVCGGTGCRAAGSAELVPAFAQEIAAAGVRDQVELRFTGCHGCCERGPLVVIGPERLLYQQVQVQDVPEIVSETLVQGRPVERLMYHASDTGAPLAHESDLPFYAGQMRVALRYNGVVDPTSLDDYLVAGGYSALSHVLTRMTPSAVIEEIERSGLRGRGGGGFPTGRKWRACAAASDPVRYLVCNGDEGDPGAFMDGYLLEGNPHGVLEGMIIGSYALGASRGFVYVRNEYPLALRHIALAVATARENGLLGDNLLDSGHSFDVEIVRGGGAFVCGEETALLQSIEGSCGEPRPKYVLPVERGLWGAPTVVNNVETWVNVPVIIQQGADWFAGLGTERSKGTKVFSVVGKVRHTGLVEVPMGTTLREIVFDICGGVAGGKRLKAVQTGGPSGGCLPAELLDLPLDYEQLTQAGSMMGSGGMIVMDEETCMVEVARYFMGFLVGESCGKCAPCREGIFQMYQILEGITQGRGRPEQLDQLEQLAETVKLASLCGLGGTAPNPVLSTLRYFREEYEAHLSERRCPAGVCRGLVSYRIDEARCTGCGLCRTNCPAEAIAGEPREPHRISADLCTRCGVCRQVCREEAVVVQ